MISKQRRQPSAIFGPARCFFKKKMRVLVCVSVYPVLKTHSFHLPLTGVSPQGVSKEQSCDRLSQRWCHHAATREDEGTPTPEPRGLALRRGCEARVGGCHRQYHSPAFNQPHHFWVRVDVVAATKHAWCRLQQSFQGKPSSPMRSRCSCW